eukprot:TRINITY_DN12450_c0_g1_i1.p1 TRINITY_DN12450_c0_g1~~TRINITY_DN12450_c0_g1_i1.p1  ORF type:complete len:708 (+),score=118.16 TRINITY_DN12450_c0_g1_i1:133-2256(+)
MSTSSQPSKFEDSGQWQDLFSVALLDGAIFLAILIGFQLLRSTQRFAYFFAPKAFSAFAPYENLPHNNGWRGILKAIHSVSNDRLYELRGLDALMHTVFLQTMLRMFGCLLPVGAVVLYINSTGLEGLTGVMRYSLTNVTDGSLRMWIHVFAGFATTAIILFWIYRTYKIFEKYSMEENTKNLAHNYTTLVRDIPSGANVQSSNVIAVHWPAKSRKLRTLIAKREDLLQEQKLMTERYQQHGEIADGDEKFVFKLRKVEQKINTIRQSDSLTAGNAALITHDSVASAYLSTRVGLRTTENSLAVVARPQPAPYVNDIMWGSLTTTRKIRALMTVLAILATFFLLFFWGVPVAFAQAIANMEHIARLPGFSWVGNVNNLGPISVSLIEGFIPPLILIIFFAVLPKIIRAIHKMRAPVSYSRLDRHVTGTYFAFKLINIYLGSSFVGGFFDIINQVRAGGGVLSFMDILKLFGSTIPGQSLFFITIILALTCITYPLFLLRPGELISSQIKVKKAKTAEEKQHRQKPAPRFYSTWYGVEILVFTIGASFTLIAPIVLPFALLFFAVAYFVAKYDSLYVTVPVHQGRGKHWHTAFHSMVAGLIMAQFTALSIMLAKGFPLAMVMLIAPLATIGFCIYAHKRFHRTCDTLPDEFYNTSIKGGFQFSESYIDPAMDDRRENFTRTENEQLDNELEQADLTITAPGKNGSANV